VRITTGAVLPPGTDTVVMRERARIEGEWIELAPGTPVGANVRAADDDWRAGDEALPAGRLLDAGALAVAASLGQATLVVRARPRVALLVTGDELVEVGAPRGHGQRFDSNRTLLAALVHGIGGRVVVSARVRDDEAALVEAVRGAATVGDLVITSGGVSAGEADLLAGVLAGIGTPWFWKVRMRPGMPVLFGAVDGTPLAALPGNPVSVYATFRMLVQPLLAQRCACPALDPPPFHARLAAPVDKTHDRLEFRRGSLRSDPDGSLHVALHPHAGSGALRSVVQSEVLVEFAAPPRHYALGEVLPVHAIKAWA
jgi:molybdopterin molybdotransferase